MVRGRSQPPPKVAASPSGCQAGTVHFWFDAPVQVQIWSLAPSAVLRSFTSRHLPLPVLTRSPDDEYVHLWLPPPKQSHSWTGVPSVVLLPVTSRHLPRPRIVPS